MDVLKMLRKAGGIITDSHFVLKSWRHSAEYINLDALFPYVWRLWKVCRALDKPFRDEYDIVVSPAVGGAVIGHFVALVSCLRGRKIMAAWADKQADGGFAFERQGFAKAVRGKRVLIVDDVMTNANPDGTVWKLCRLVEDAEGIIVGVSLICNRCKGTAQQLSVPKLEQLSEVDFGSSTEQDCQATGPCSEGTPIVADIGHGAEYLLRHSEKESITVLS